MNKLISKPVFWLIVITLLAGILRIPFLDRYPPALYSDEASQGYNAYAVLKTGRDEFGTLLPVSFRSFGDWKPPLTTYLMIPTIAVFGLNAYGVRLSSALLGTATVWLVYFLTLEILDYFSIKETLTHRKRIFISLVTALFLAISPWHILQSRSAMLVGNMLFCLCLSLWAFFRSLRNSRFLYLSAFGFVLTIYSYYGARLIVPLLLIMLCLYFYSFLQKYSRQVIISCILALVLLLPLLINFISEPDVIVGRAKTVSIFYDQGTKLNVWNLIADDDMSYPGWLSQFFHNKPYYYAVDILRRFLQHIDWNFLFLKGDTSPPFQIPNMGILYLFDLPLLIIGLIFLLRKQDRLLKFLLIFVAIAIAPAALTYVTPSANRTLNMILPLIIISAYGLVEILKLLKYRKICISIISVIIIINFTFFLYQYFIFLPKYTSNYWHFGYKELFAYLKTQETKVDYITLSGKIGVPYIFKLFYDQVDPNTLSKDIHRNYHADEYGFEFIESYKNYKFFRYFDWQKDQDNLPPHSLLVVSAQENIDNLPLIKQLYYPDESLEFKVYKIE